MKTITVCLRLMNHPLYDSIAKFPPYGVRYQFPKLSTTKGSCPLVKKLKQIFWIQYTKFKPPAIYIKTDADLIYSGGAMMILNKKPWVIDIANAAAFTNYHTDKLNNPSYKKAIIKLVASDFCKKIMPISFAAKKSVEGYIPSIKDKLEVVYPAIEKFLLKKKKYTDTVKLLFVGKYSIFAKGGMQLLKAFEILNKKYDVELIMIANVPENLKNKYKNIANIKFISPKLSVDKVVKNYFLTSDIFVFPTFMDTFGSVLLQAMSSAMPIVTTDIYSAPEIVEDGKTGFLVHTPKSYFNKDGSMIYGEKTKEWYEYLEVLKSVDGMLINGLVEKISKLIENKSLRKQMGRAGRKEVEKGKFSIKKRNEKLRKIYEEAIKTRG